ncbi:hypothetical protein ESCOCK443M_24310 [Escherichia coli]
MLCRYFAPIDVEKFIAFFIVFGIEDALVEDVFGGTAEFGKNRTLS